MAGRRDSVRKGDGGGEYRTGGPVRTALISGNTFHAKAVQYEVIDGLAIFEGDIVLGTAEEVEAASEALRSELTGQSPASVVISGTQFRWPNCTVPFTIDSALPNQTRVTQAIANWETNTGFRFVARTTEADFVTFRAGSGCSSAVGRRGGQQFVTIENPGCDVGRVIHEIGHVVGFWHEQSRQDRDIFVLIHWDKIDPSRVHNFDQHVTDGDDVGAYDYGSIMHYERGAFSIDGSDTITPINPATAAIGQRVALSAGDIASANTICPVLKSVFNDPLTRKELVKEIRFDTKKEQIADLTRKEFIKEGIKDGAFDPRETWVETIDPFGLGRVIQPGWGGLRAGGAGRGLPFAMRTPHQAPGAMGQADIEQTIATLDTQLGALAEQIAQLGATHQQVQAQYDETARLLAEAIDAHDQASGS